MRTGLIFLLVAGALVAGLAGVARPERWPPPEAPPQQGEAACDASRTSSKTGLTHSSQALGHLIREPQNTWSNLAFVLGGAWLVSARSLRLARITGVALIGVGAGSFFYHAS